MNTEISSEAIRRLMNLFPVVLSFLLLSCSTREATRALDKAESMMESHPDSSLMVLGMMDKSLLDSESARARYALLMSMALDKNYVDTTKFDVLQPAIDYYLKKGSPDEKLRTYYYQGRIFQNQKDYDKAMNSFLKGIDISPECKDSLTLARTLVAQGYLYFEFYDFENYTNSNLRAADICRCLSHKNYEFLSLLNALNGAVVLDNKIRADSIMNLIDLVQPLTEGQNRLLLERKLSYALKFGSRKDLETMMAYKDRFLESDANCILDVISAYNKLGNDQMSIMLFDYLNNKNIDYDTLKYKSICVSVYKNMGKYEEALSAYEDFSHRVDLLNSIKFNQKIHSINEKYEIEFEAQKDARRKGKMIWGCVWGMVILTMGISILIVSIRSNKMQKDLAIQRVRSIELENNNLKSEREKLSLEYKNLQLEKEKKELEAENLSNRVERLEEESYSLKRLIGNKEELPFDVQKAIKVRIEMLNSLLAGYITDNEKYEKSYEIWVKELTENTKEFMNSNRLAFQASHPRFIQYFEDHGLTVDEINYVCLYAIGLRGKEVGNYMKKRSHVNTSSAIRKKLGIDKHETNIGIYVRRLLKNL
ncbi:MAG: hypothetical protein K2J48_07880 [Muribaculaceae bacterium]|nr:hypothetical protein [Muribaculaceae bacterium]